MLGRVITSALALANQAAVGGAVADSACALFFHLEQLMFHGGAYTTQGDAANGIVRGSAGGGKCLMRTLNARIVDAMSRRPNAATVCSTRLATYASSATSHTMPRTS
jgi:hypothetical protein